MERRLSAEKMRRLFAVCAIVSAISVVSPVSAQQIPALAEVGQAVAARQPSLLTERTQLLAERARLHRSVIELNGGCSAINEHDQAKIAACTTKRQELKTELDRHIAQSRTFNASVAAGSQSIVPSGASKPALVAKVIAAMDSLAKKLGWSADKQARLHQALAALSFDGDANATNLTIIAAWQDVLARGPDKDLARLAAQGAGPGFPGAGQQMHLQDCAIFALANAANLPYGVVGARAAELIREGTWRTADERAHPEKTIAKGLTGGEVVMLAVAFGDAKVVPSASFAKTLADGQRIMINVVPSDGNVDSGHQVVLTKAFQRNGQTWYEMMDSNQGPLRRLYVRNDELSTMLQENGVAYRPDAGRTPRLLR